MTYRKSSDALAMLINVFNSVRQFERREIVKDKMLNEVLISDYHYPRDLSIQLINQAESKAMEITL